MVVDSHSIIARRRNVFSQLFNVHGVSNVRQTGIHTAEPLLPKPRAFDFEMLIDKLQSHKLPVIFQITSEFIKAGV